MMQLTSQQYNKQLMDDGYIICRGIIRPDELQSLRRSVDAYVDKEPNARVWMTRAVDRDCADALEFCVDERVFEFSRDLMKASDAAGTGMWVLCAADTGWHRDIQPSILAPLDGLQDEIRHNGPSYVQWNIALYRDPYLHVVPGSHLRRNNEYERKIERRDGVVPLPGMTCVDLEPGDGVVYINAILHSATPSRDNKRATLHFGYRGFGIQGFFHQISPVTLGVDFVEHLSPWAAERCRNFERLQASGLDEVACLFRAMVDRDGQQFRQTLLRMHPGPHGRMTVLACLSRLSYRLLHFQDPNTNEFGYANGPRIQDLANRFTVQEIEQLWARFAVLDAKLQSDQVQHEPLFQGGQTKYYLYEMPKQFEVEDFIASWNS